MSTIGAGIRPKLASGPCDVSLQASGHGSRGHPHTPSLEYHRLRCRLRQGRAVAAAAAAAAADGICTQKATWGSVERLAVHPPKLSKTDAQFAKEGLEFMHGASSVPIGELNELFSKVGFPRRDPVALQDALARTHQVLWIRNTKQTRWARNGQLIGFARATSDGVCAATIWDVAVLPSWQKDGIGRGLMERLIASLVSDNINAITLYAEPKVVRMYQRLGFTSDPAGIKGLAYRKTAAKGAFLMEHGAQPTKYISIIDDSRCDKFARSS